MIINTNDGNKGKTTMPIKQRKNEKLNKMFYDGTNLQLCPNLVQIFGVCARMKGK